MSSPASQEAPRRKPRWLLASAIAIALLSVIGLGIASMYPLIRDMPRRHQIAAIIVSTSDLRGEIAARAQEKNSLAGSGVGLTVPTGEALTGGEVSADGIVVVRGLVDGYPVEIGFKPQLYAGQIEWHCGGLKGVEGLFVRPGAYFPSSCPLVPSLDVFPPLPPGKFSSPRKS